jgi:hypothetical protein
MLLSSRSGCPAASQAGRSGSRAPVACNAPAQQQQQRQQRRQQQQQQQQSAQPLASLAAAAALACCLAAAPPAFADAPRSSEPGQNVGFLTNKDIDTRRQQAGFRRSYDGRVAIQNKSTQEWLDAKCDLQVGLGLWLAGKGGAAAGAGAPARSTLERMGAGRAGAHPPPPAAAGAAQMRCITAAWRDRRHGVTGSSSARS